MTIGELIECLEVARDREGADAPVAYNYITPATVREFFPDIGPEIEVWNLIQSADELVNQEWDALSLCELAREK